MPKSRGRKKPSKKRQQANGHPGAASGRDAVGRLLRQFTLTATDVDPLEAEAMASAVCGTGWQADGPGGDGYEAVEDLLATARRGSPRGGSLEFACLAASMVPDADLAAQAREVADELMARGASEPTWFGVLDQLTVGDCWTIRDIYGDFASVLCSFERAGRVHALVTTVDFTHLGGWAKDIALVDDVVQAVSMMREAADDDDALLMEQADPAEVRRLLEDAFEATDMTMDAEVSEDFADLRALALARLRVLPGPAARPEAVELDDKARTEIVREFLASPGAAELPDKDTVEHLARLMVNYGADYDEGKVLRVSPAKTEIFLLGWLPRKAVLDADDRAALPSMIPAWIKWAGTKQGLPVTALDEVLLVAQECLAHFDEAYDDTANMSPARMLLAGAPETAGVEDLQDVLDRRMFAMPYFGTRIGDEDFPHLDPNDPDERAILIQGEHPEYHAVLDDPSFDGEIDGVNPRLHLAMHEIVAAQLWDNDPPEAWEAARRLQDQGYDRHDILHAIADVVARQLHPALADKQPFDTEKYRSTLDQLGR
jgi:hypothetical protein